MLIPRPVTWAQLLILRILNVVAPRAGRVQLFAPFVRIYCRDEFPLVSYREVFVDRSYEPPVALPPQPRILDIGGHLGMATLYFARRFKEAVIDVFEANPEACALLRQTLAGERSATIRLHECAIGPTAGTAKLFVASGPRIPTDASIVRHYSDKPGAVIEVVMEDIRTAAAGMVDLLKLDIEGLEYDCLEALSPSPNYIRNLVIEFHDCPRQSERLAQRIAALRTAGYRILDEDGRETAAENKEKHDAILIWAVAPA